MTGLADIAGLSVDEEAFYRALIVSGGSALEAIATKLGLPMEKASRLAAALQRKGLVSRAAGDAAQYLAVAPEVAFQPYLSGRETQLHVARAALSELAEQHRSARSHRTSELIEVITGASAIAQRFQLLQHQAVSEILMLTKPPFAVSAGHNDAEIDALGRGVLVRSLYDRDALATWGGLDTVRRYVSFGETARVTGELPIKLIVIDSKVALLPLMGDDERKALDGALVVHPCGLLDSLVALFETLWVLGAAVPAATSAETAPVGLSSKKSGSRLNFSDEELIVLLFAGLTDQAIAKQLGVSPRTVQRQIRALMDSHGARSRFQLGAIAQERGLLG